jgi:predicted CoA-binding protein
MMVAKKTLVIGASTNPEQYSHIAIIRLLNAGHPVEAIGRTPFTIGEIEVCCVQEAFEGIDTVTMYLNEARQQDYQAYILSLHPSRIIFNPGAENAPFKRIAENAGIETLNACTLVMLATGAY